jgi:hypothetical protein
VLATTCSTCINAVSTHVTPLGKAIAMIGELRDKVSVEGLKEAKTYEKFACACQNITTSKTDAITTGQAGKDSLQAQINEAMANRDSQDQAIAEAVKGIDDTSAEVEQLTAQRQSERHEFGKNEMDLTGAVQALNSAIHALQSSQTAVASFAQLRSAGQIKTVKRALEMAEMLNIAGQQQLVVSSLAALQKAESASEPFEVPASQYDFHSSDILATLEKLKTDFRAKKEELQAQETSAIATHDKLMQDKATIISQHKEALTQAKKTKAEHVSSIASASQDLTTTAAQLLDDQKYLAEVSDVCSSKAALWDKRKELRANELQGLTKTLEIISALEKKSMLEVRMSRNIRRTSVSFMQLAAVAGSRHVSLHQRSLAPTGDRRLGRRARAMELLRSRAKALHSAWLLGLMRETSSADPLAKVKTMIQELVERLLKEAQEEENHKGFCDKEVALAEQQRDTSATAVAEANTQLAVLEAKRAKLTRKVSTLKTDMSELTEMMTNSTALREQEKTESTAAIAEAQEGVTAITEALRILTEYYGTAANAEVSLIAASDSTAAAQLPDAGFEDVYTGDLGNGGVIAMLEVLKSDFERTITMTTEAEKTAESDYNKEQTAAGASLAEKEVALKERQSQLSDADIEDQEFRTQMKSQQESLDKALDELDALQPACFDGGMTAEERKLKREEEISALKEALDILDNHGSN